MVLNCLTITYGGDEEAGTQPEVAVRANKEEEQRRVVSNLSFAFLERREREREIKVKQ